MADSTVATGNAVNAVEADAGLELLDAIPAALYIWGEVHRVWDKTQRRTGEVKYYARLLIEDEPGTFQVNITDLPPGDIRYMATHEREMVLLAVRLFVVEGSTYWKATDLITSESLAAEASASSGGSILDDLRNKSGSGKAGKSDAA